MPKDVTSRSAITELKQQELTRYRLYDRNVDIVSCFEALFVEQEEIRLSVKHFERFPQCTHPDGAKATPDFTVLLNDGTAIVAEIANFPRDDRGVDSLCRQLLRYENLSSIPASTDNQDPPGNIDVVYLAPFDTGNDPIDRIIKNRQHSETHFYQPKKAPIVVFFSNDGDKYTFTRNRDPQNGEFSHERVHEFIDSKYAAPGSFWTPTKVARPFMNDEPPILYTTCIVWLKILPALYAGQPEFGVSVDEVTAALRDFFGYGRKKMVRDSFAMLTKAGLATPDDQRDSYNVKRSYRSRGEEDFVQTLLDRFYPSLTTIKRSVGRSRRLPTSKHGLTHDQYSLFDAQAES